MCLLIGGHGLAQIWMGYFLARSPLSLCSHVFQILFRFSTEDLFPLAPLLTIILHHSLSHVVFQQHSIAQFFCHHISIFNSCLRLYIWNCFVFATLFILCHCIHIHHYLQSPWEGPQSFSLFWIQTCA